MQAMSGTEGIYAARGFGGRQGAGERPCLLVIDFNYAFTDPASPMYCEADDALVATARLIERARSAGVPVIYTTVAYDAAGLHAARAFLAKAPRLADMTPGSRWSTIDERVAPLEQESVLVKYWASAFFSTPLASLLIAHACDTVVVTGASTSGCVRATAVDALQHGYRVLVPREAVADRAPSAHEATLVDIDAKYGDVVGLQDALDALGPVRAGSTTMV
jgi:maleamate amidohydrolase